jgi:cell division ATPase FtsA
MSVSPLSLWSILEQMPRRAVVSRSSLAITIPRAVGVEDVERIFSRAVEVREEAKILRVTVIRWMLDGRKVDNPVGLWGRLLEADVQMVVEE